MVDDAVGLTLRFGFRAGVGARLGDEGGTNEIPGELSRASQRRSDDEVTDCSLGLA